MVAFLIQFGLVVAAVIVALWLAPRVLKRSA